MALDGLLRAALAGTTGYLSGRGLRQQREQAEAEAAEQREYERQRQAQQDALLAQLRQAQIEAQKALARDRDREPVPVARNIDPLSAQGIQAAAARAAAIERARARVQASRGGPAVAAPTAPSAPTPTATQIASYVATMPTEGRTANQLASAAYVAWLNDLAPQQRAVVGSGTYRQFLSRAQDRLAKEAGGGLTNEQAIIAWARNPNADLSTFPGMADEGEAPADTGAAPVTPAVAPTRPMPARAPLSAEAKAKARTDGMFAAFLMEKGYTTEDWR